MLSRSSVLSMPVLDRYDKFPFPGARLTYQFSSLLAALFLLIDTVVLIGSTLFLDHFLSSEGYPGISLDAMMKRVKHPTSVEDLDVENEGDDFETMPRKDTQPGVKVVGLKKRYDSDNVVDGVTFAAYSDEITCLLGHNGAGKTTLFNCLTGYTRPSAGTVLVGDTNIARDIREARRLIGYCPQTNPLHDRLTCAEHLELAARLRGTYCGAEDVLEVLKAVGLETASEKLAEQLSGGMKRKLCVALALVGKSQVVLLDEPSAGMDPTARHQIEAVLNCYKSSRTIILTTHYMDEADLLADKIIILANGRIVCSGSSDFLKKRFGTGFLLTIAMVDGISDARRRAQTILEKIRFYVPEAMFDGLLASQFMVNLPYESKTRFAPLFVMLESQSAQLGIDSFGLSLNTLEQVFLKVEEKVGRTNHDEFRRRLAQNVELIHREVPNRRASTLEKLAALWDRNFKYWLQHPVRTTMPFLVTLLCVGLLLLKCGPAGNAPDRTTPNASETVLYSLSDLPKSKILLDRAFVEQARTLFAAPLKQCKLVQVENAELHSAKHAFDVPPPIFGMSRNVENNTVFVSRFLDGGAVVALNMYSNWLLNRSYDAITFGYVVPKRNGTGFSLFDTLSRSDFFTSILVVIAISFAMSLLLTEVITERVSRFKHQLYLAGANGPVYWTAQLGTDFVYYVVLAVVILGAAVLISRVWFTCAVGILPVMLLYFLTASCANYFLSFMFSSSMKASVLIIAFHTIIPLMAFVLMTLAVLMMMILSYRPNESTDFSRTVSYVNLLLNVFFPDLALLSAQRYMFDVCSAESSALSLYTWRSEFVSTEIDRQSTFLDIKTWCSVIGLVLGLLFYGALLVLFEWDVFRRLHNKLVTMTATQPPLQTDIDPYVVAEKLRISKLDDAELALACRGLYKFCTRDFCAIKDLSFGIDPGECFGLLGVNGAGKTTTFEIISNTIKANRGVVTVFGVDVERNPTLGYCPQFDALSKSMTVKDVLRLVARLNGFSNVETRVNLILECVLMQGHANKVVDRCSGGQKRRISIAVMLMSGAKFLILDEPSAGVDPGTRRHLWDLLLLIKEQNKSILLTTHSMEECEALCNRVGFLRAGRLCSVGTSQSLKSRFGTSCILTLVQAVINETAACQFDAEVRRRFSAAPTQERHHSSSLTWTIPLRSNTSWSRLYSDVDEFVNQMNHRHVRWIKDFYLVQDSLEQVFTRLATSETVVNKPVMKQRKTLDDQSAGRQTTAVDVFASSAKNTDRAR